MAHIPLQELLGSIGTPLTFAGPGAFPARVKSKLSVGILLIDRIGNPFLKACPIDISSRTRVIRLARLGNIAVGAHIVVLGTWRYAHFRRVVLGAMVISESRSIRLNTVTVR